MLQIPKIVFWLEYLCYTIPQNLCPLRILVWHIRTRQTYFLLQRIIVNPIRVSTGYLKPGLYGSLKTWKVKVMEFNNFIFQAWKVICQWKVAENNS